MEMRIPFSELRFLPGDCQTWGVNASRFIPRKNESDWLESRPEGGEWPRLTHGRAPGLAWRQAPRPARRRSLRRGRRRDRARRIRAIPSSTGATAFGSVGLDLRRKIGAGFALDATVNPDFGQVEVDPAVVNLTDFETFFPEKRPFFVEGSQIFDELRPQRSEQLLRLHALRARPVLHAPHRARAAGLPRGRVRLDAARPRRSSAPPSSRARRASGWSVGLLEAVTGRETRPVVDRRRHGPAGSRAAQQLPRRCAPTATRRAPGYGTALHRGQPRPRRAHRSRTVLLAPSLRRRRRRLHLSRPEEGLGGLGPRGSEPRGRRPQRPSTSSSSPRPATSSVPTGPSSRLDPERGRHSAAGRAA